MNRRTVLVLGGVVIVTILAIAAFASSRAPDGLQSVATEQGFADQADDHALDDSPVSGYEVEGIEGGTSKLLAGALGALMTFGIGYAWFKFAGSGKRRGEDP